MIYSPRPFNNRVSCTKIIIGQYEISISMDDSCDSSRDTLNRTDICVFDGNEDVTHRFWHEDRVPCSADDLMSIMSYCKNITAIDDPSMRMREIPSWRFPDSLKK